MPDLSLLRLCCRSLRRPTARKETPGAGSLGALHRPRHLMMAARGRELLCLPGHQLACHCGSATALPCPRGVPAALLGPPQVLVPGTDPSAVHIRFQKCMRFQLGMQAQKHDRALTAGQTQPECMRRQQATLCCGIYSRQLAQQEPWQPRRS